MNEKLMTRADFVTSLVLILFGAYIAYDSWRMPRFAEQQASAWSAPGIVPGILGLLFVLMGGILFVRSMRKGGHHLGLSSAAFADLFKAPTTVTFLVTLGLCLLYGVVFMGHIPYPIGTGLFVFLFVYVTEFRRGRPRGAEVRAIAVAAVIAVVSATVVTLVFRDLFLVTLP